MIKIEKIKIENFGSINKTKVALDNIVLVHNDGISDKINDLMLVIKYFLNIGQTHPFNYDFDSITEEFNSKLTNKTNIEISFVFDKHYFVYNYKQNNITVTDYVSRFKMKSLLCYNFMSYVFNPNITSYGYISSLCDNYSLADYSDELNSTLYKLKNGLQIEGLDISLIFNEDRYNKAYTDILEEFSYFNPLALCDNVKVFLSDNGIKIMDNNGNKLDISYLNKNDKDTFNLGCFLILNKLLDNILKMEDTSLINTPLIISHSIDRLSNTALKNILKSSLVKDRQIFLEQDTIAMHKLQSMNFNQSTFITEINNNILVRRTIK